MTPYCPSSSVSQSAPLPEKKREGNFPQIKYYAASPYHTTSSLIWIKLLILVTDLRSAKDTWTFTRDGCPGLR